MPRRSLFLVEDDNIIRENFTELLSGAGFDITGFSGDEGVLVAAKKNRPDLFLLDISLGNERDGGFELCRNLRSWSATTPIVFLSSRDSDIDKISGLRLGADDYITKDTSFDYILVRIETLLRRVDLLVTEPRNLPKHYPSNNLALETIRCEAFWKGTKVDLTLTQYWIVAALFENPGSVKRLGELMTSANIVVEPNTIAAHIKAIRSAFKAIDPDFECIKTERGKGYRWLD
jgi:two-component system OmpR family response regulator